MTAMTTDLVSIVTPAYKAAATINETIASVRAQTVGNWELLVSEDCGPDNTRELVREWQRRDERIRLIEPLQNGGPAAARNAALEQAKGRWIAFLDSDDIWLPTKLDRQLAFHQASPGTKISFTGFRRMSAEGDRIGRYISVPRRLDYKALLKNTAIATSTVIVDRHQTGNLVMKSTYYDDFACWLEILKSGGWAAGLNEDLMRYRMMSGSVSRNKGNSAKQVWLAYRNIEKLGPVVSAWNFAHYSARALLKYRRF
jgi:teichuronic acid biosynthesis glycosyltransferase TuaG